VYNLGLFLNFLTPQHLPDQEGDSLLPSRNDQEFRPFQRKLNEFKFWYASARSLAMGLLMTSTRLFDLPVFAPILVFYWVVLFVVTMRRQVFMWKKYKYLPFNLGKKTYGASSGGAPAPSKDGK